MPATHDSGTRMAPVFATLIICFAFIVFVTVYDDLRTDQTWQRTAVVVLTVAVAVILFSVVPSRAVVKGAVALSGAAAFFYVILPMIMKQIFPLSVTITGNIYRQTTGTQGEPLLPVEGVIVYVRDISRESQPTDRTGRFVIDNIQYRPKELMVSYGGAEYAIDPKKYPDGKYAVIPREKTTSRSELRSIPREEWTEISADTCPSASLKTYSQVKQFRLETVVPAESAGSELYLQVAIRKLKEPDQEPEIYDAHKFQPGPGAGAEVLVGSERLKLRQWRVPASDGNVRVVLGVCVGTKSHERPPTAADLNASYWFVKEG
jgi:hypothetical protein